MKQKIIKYLGLLVIILVSTFGTAVTQFEAEISYSKMNENLKKILRYPSVLEEIFYDFRFKTLLDKKARDPRIVLGAVDEESLKKLGRWPWGRETWIPIIQKLKHYGAKVIAFDVIFSEPEKSNEEITPDQKLRDAIADFQSVPGNKVVLSYSLATMSQDEDYVAAKETPDVLFDFMMNANEGGKHGLIKKRVMSTTFPIPTLLEANPSLGFIGASEDLDGVFRRYMAVTNIEDLYFTSLSLETYKAFTGKKPELDILPSGDAFLKVGSPPLPLNLDGETKIRWFGTTGAYPVVGLSNLLEADPNDPDYFELLKGRIVFIGSTSFGAHDFRNTPVDTKLPGVFLHMNFLQMLLDGRFFQEQNKSFYWSWAFLIGGTLLMFFVSAFGNAVIDVCFLGCFMLGLYLSDRFYFLPKGYELTLFFAHVSVIGTYLWDTLLGFYLASKDKAFLKEAFGSYISPELIDEMYERGEPPKLGGHQDVLTAYFTDIQSFSTFSETLTPTQLVELLNEYLTAMTDILLEEHGTLDKYEGDAIIAFFGAPMPLKDHAARACRVALGMQASLLELRKKWEGEGDKWPEIVHDMRMRIGINSGDIVTGNMGSKARMNYTMMGDSVNLAARLEEAAKQYGIFNHVSEYTLSHVEGQFEVRELDKVRVVGKSVPVTTYDLLGETGKTSDDLMTLQKLFHEGLKEYKSQNWEKAIKFFNQSVEYEYKRYPRLKGKKTNPSLIYIERCEKFKENPPSADWDGVFTLTSK